MSTTITILLVAAVFGVFIWAVNGGPRELVSWIRKILRTREIAVKVQEQARTAAILSAKRWAAGNSDHKGTVLSELEIRGLDRVAIQVISRMVSDVDSVRCSMVENGMFRVRVLSLETRTRVYYLLFDLRLLADIYSERMLVQVGQSTNSQHLQVKTNHATLAVVDTSVSPHRLLVDERFGTSYGIVEAILGVVYGRVACSETTDKEEPIDDLEI